MYWLLFFVYLLFFCWMLTRLPFVRRSGLPWFIAVGLFLLKVITGVCYGWLFSRPEFIDRSDTWRFYRESLPETELLKTDPLLFIRSFFQTGYGTTGGLFSDQSSYWNDAKDAVMIKLMAIANVLTGSHYYINVIFFSAIFFLGVIACVRLLDVMFKVKAIWLVPVFLMPAFLFWCSGLHKDGLVFTVLAFIFYSYHGLLLRRNRATHFAILLISFVLLFFLRNYLVFLLLPCLLVGTMLHRYPKRRALVLVTSFVIAIFLFVGGSKIHPALDVPGVIAAKEAQFRSLEGATKVEEVPLTNEPISFLRRLPGALDMLLLRPHLDEPGMLSVVSSLEWLITLALMIFLALRFLRQPETASAVVVAMWLFVLAAWLVIAYTVPFSGAISRYRCLYIPLVLGPLWASWIARKQIIKKYI